MSSVDLAVRVFSLILSACLPIRPAMYVYKSVYLRQLGLSVGFAHHVSTGPIFI